MNDTHLVEYIGQMAKELAQLSRGDGLERLNYICRMAAEEAAQIKLDRKPSIQTLRRSSVA